MGTVKGSPTISTRLFVEVFWTGLWVLFPSLSSTELYVGLSAAKVLGWYREMLQQSNYLDERCCEVQRQSKARAFRRAACSTLLEGLLEGEKGYPRGFAWARAWLSLWPVGLAGS
jgi:hypothetical protein